MGPIEDEDEPSDFKPGAVVSISIKHRAPPDHPPPPPDEEEEPPPIPQRAQCLQAADDAAKSLSNAPLGGPVAACPPKDRFAVEVVVSGEDDRPLVDVPIELALDERSAIHSKTDVDGRVRFEGLKKQGYTVTIPSLDRDAWKVDGNEPAGVPESQGDAQFGPPSVDGAKGTQHVVQQGETVSELAVRYGLTPDAIWGAPANKSLVEKRKDKNILLPGDEVAIPAPRPKREPVEVGKLYRLTRLGVAEVLRVRFVDGGGKPRASVPYLVQFEDAGVKTSRDGETDPDGFLVQPVPPNVDRVEAIQGTGDEADRYSFQVGYLDPSDSLSGVQGRLRSLGYYCGDETGKAGPMTSVALADFQRDFGLDVTAKPDDATIEKLEELHLS